MKTFLRSSVITFAVALALAACYTAAERFSAPIVADDIFAPPDPNTGLPEGWRS